MFDTEKHALRIKPIQCDKQELRGVSDSEFAGDRNTRISVYGYVIYYSGAPI